MTHKEAHTAALNDELYGSQCSRQYSNSLVMVLVSGETIPCFIQKFFEVSVVLNVSDTTNDGIHLNSPVAASCMTIHIALVCKLVPHSKKNYYGDPIEVWQQNFDSSSEEYVFVDDIVCQCAYLKVQDNNHFCRIQPSHVDYQVIIVCPINHLSVFGN